MVSSVLRRLGAVCALVLICFAPAMVNAEAEPIVVNPLHRPPPIPEPTDPIVVALQIEGYSLPDIYAAFDLERKSDVDAKSWLLEFSETGSWQQVAQQAHDSGVELRDPWRTAGPVSVDLRVISSYQDQGHTLLDVFEAAELATNFGITMDQAFSLKSSDGSWRQVQRELIMLAEGRSQTTTQLPPDGCSFLGWGDPIETQSETGMNRLEVCSWREKGYQLSDITRADLMTLDWEVTVLEALTLRQQGVRWEEIERAFPRKLRLWFKERDVIQNTGLNVDQIDAFVKQGYNHHDLMMAAGFAKKRKQSIEEILKVYDAKGRSWSLFQKKEEPDAFDVSISLGLPLAEVEALEQKGAKPVWVLIAHHASKTEGRPLLDILDEMIKNNGRRKVTRFAELTIVGPDGKPTIVERTRSGLTLDQVNALMKEFAWYDIDQADQWAVHIDVNVQLLFQDLRKGLTWEQIKAKDYKLDQSLAAIAKALRVSESTEVLIKRADADKLRALGLDPDEQAKAGLIAKVLKRPVLDVAKLKRVDNTWFDVIALLKKR